MKRGIAALGGGAVDESGVAAVGVPGGYRQPWIGNAGIETVFILLPPFVSLAVVAAFPGMFHDGAGVPVAWWVILILLVDVAHVYSTLYRTYFDRRSFERWRWPLVVIPPVALVAGILLYAMDALWFWRILAYLAVFHFIRQQYGFMRIYSRMEAAPRWARRVDTFTIYYATIYPLIYWHLGAPRNFNWFVDDDFLLFRNSGALEWATVLYAVMIVVYVGREMWSWWRSGYVNVPRVGIILGTLLSWYFGIVYFNGDLAFTLLNVVSHGIPYMALIWLFGKKGMEGMGATERIRVREGMGATAGVRAQKGMGAREGIRSALLRKVFSRYGIVLFLGIIFLLAYVEEGLWDMTVWKEHVKVFSVFHVFGGRLHGNWLTLVVPLLALPQVTHYVIDGFIWRKPKTG